MSVLKCFISYAREDAEAAEWLEGELSDMGHDVWRDTRLTGGQAWWDAILEAIRSADRLLFVQSPASISSKSSRAELRYAEELGTSLLPVAVGTPVPDVRLPPALANTHRVDATADRVGAGRMPTRALFAIGPRPPLPDPVPPPPPVPTSYLAPIAQQLEQAELSPAQQWALLGQLRHDLSTGSADIPDVIELLKAFRGRHDLLAAVATEIDAIMPATPTAGSSEDVPPRRPDGARPAATLMRREPTVVEWTVDIADAEPAPVLRDEMSATVIKRTSQFLDLRVRMGTEHSISVNNEDFVGQILVDGAICVKKVNLEGVHRLEINDEGTRVPVSLEVNLNWKSEFKRVRLKCGDVTLLEI